MKRSPASAPIPTPAYLTPDAALQPGALLGGFEVQRVVARSAGTVVYMATDPGLARPVALQEYLPARFVRRAPDNSLRSTDPWHEDVIARGRRAFVDETRLLAHCDHPALVRVLHLFEANGTVCRVMPFVHGKRLLDLRRETVGAPTEDTLRDLFDALLGAIEAIHRSDQVHGGVSPANILLLDGGRPLLLGPGAASGVLGSSLVESLMANLAAPAGTPGEPGEAFTPPTGVAADLCALAEVLRFCITGVPPPVQPRARDTLAVAIARTFEPATRPHYSPELMSVIDVATSAFAEHWPRSGSELREWLAFGAPHAPGAPEPVIVLRPDPKPPELPAAVAPLPVATVRSDGPTASRAVPAPMPERPIESAAPAEAPAAAPAPARSSAPPSLPPQLTRTPSPWRHKALLAGGLVLLLVLAMVVVAFTTGAWNQAPAIPLGNTDAGPAAGPAADPLPVPVPVPVPVPAPAPAPAALPDVAGAGSVTEAPPAPRAAAAPVPAPARPTRDATGDPRAACVGKSEFALYRCMQQQCANPRWSGHARCVRLRENDQVD